MAGTHTDIGERKRNEEVLREKLEIIERQRAEIRVLSTPVIEVWEGVLMLPMIGELDAARAEMMLESLLDAVVRTQSRYVIIDLTGVSAIDTETTEYVVRLVSAVALLGAKGLVVGIQAGVARALVTSRADLPEITTMKRLRDALVLCMKSGAQPRRR